MKEIYRLRILVDFLGIDKLKDNNNFFVNYEMDKVLGVFSFLRIGV